ncbi:MAG: hypothetical protein RMX97_14215 [Nostoc sp. DedQUE11]|nr:hypothetical protein [Nostoc sp. DedQUE11]
MGNIAHQKPGHNDWVFGLKMVALFFENRIPNPQSLVPSPFSTDK